jgi:hypothetical protein
MVESVESRCVVRVIRAKSAVSVDHHARLKLDGDRRAVAALYDAPPDAPRLDGDRLAVSGKGCRRREP